MTETELRLIAAAAIIGLRRIPNAGYSTPDASGTPRPLYPKANHGFWRMLRIVACESERARVMAWRSPLTKVKAALSIATSVHADRSEGSLRCTQG